MKNKKTMKVSEVSDNFFFDVQSNVGLMQKNSNLKRIKVTKTSAQDLMVKYFKENNDRYLELMELINTSIQNGNN